MSSRARMTTSTQWKACRFPCLGNRNSPRSVMARCRMPVHHQLKGRQHTGCMRTSRRRSDGGPPARAQPTKGGGVACDTRRPEITGHILTIPDPKNPPKWIGPPLPERSSRPQLTVKPGCRRDLPYDLGSTAASGVVIGLRPSVQASSQIVDGTAPGTPARSRRRGVSAG